MLRGVGPISSFNKQGLWNPASCRGRAAGVGGRMAGSKETKDHMMGQSLHWESGSWWSCSGSAPHSRYVTLNKLPPLSEPLTGI